MSPIQDWPSPGGTSGGDTAGPYDETIRLLAELPRPRVVRMSRRGKSRQALSSTKMWPVWTLRRNTWKAWVESVGKKRGALAWNARSHPFALMKKLYRWRCSEF